MTGAGLNAALTLFMSLLVDGRTGVLLLLLGVAAVVDTRSHRIPNGLVVAGVVYALVYNTVFPPVAGGTILWSLAGLGLGLLLFLPLYVLRAMGAGDVKLMAMVGAFLGPGQVWQAALATLMMGGLLAIVFVLVKGRALRAARNLSALFQVGALDALSGNAPTLRVSAQESAGRLPYGVAIALGTAAYLVVQALI